jgi:RNA polymerase sigma factor (sigma-70 family)
LSGATGSPFPQPRSHPIGTRLVTDDRLARLAAAGSREAFAAIYERHHQRLYRYCRSILHNGDDADDALQNTMLKALCALPGEQRQIALRPWLHRIAHNESLSLLRRRRPEQDISEALRVEGETSDGAVLLKERLRQLVADLQELPERQRGALLMREVSGLEYSEIATALAISPAAAKQCVYEARTSLHDYAGGREMGCEKVRHAISACDGRRLRNRKLRAHLRVCAGCRDFRAALSGREAELAALAPPIPATAAAALLESVLNGGAESGGGGLMALLVSGGGQAAGGSVAVKAALVVGATALTVGTGALTVGGTGLPGSSATERDEAPAGPTEAATIAASELGRVKLDLGESRGAVGRTGDATDGPRGGEQADGVDPVRASDAPRGAERRPKAPPGASRRRARGAAAPGRQRRGTPARTRGRPSEAPRGHRNRASERTDDSGTLPRLEDLLPRPDTGPPSLPPPGLRGGIGPDR